MSDNFVKKIFICATEQSGDNIGKNILKGLKNEIPSLIVDGVGGDESKPFLRNQIYSLKEFKSMGIIEILFSIKKYFIMIRNLSKIVFNGNYDLVITIDSPDFNYPFSKKLRKYGYKGKIIQIVAPTVWAWREYRAKKFANIFDEIFTLFSFEKKFFEKFNLKTTYIGHPIYYIKNQSKLLKNKNAIAFLPGSRLGEIRSLFFFYQTAYEQLLQTKSKYIIFIPTLSHLKDEIIDKTKKWQIETIITTDNEKIENYYLKTKFALVCSGTATLEIAKRGIPQLIIYKLNYLTELIASFFVKVKFANIINILENKMIITELTNSKLSKNVFIKKFNNLLMNEESNNRQIQEVNKVIKKIEMSKSPYKIAVEAIQKIL